MQIVKLGLLVELADTLDSKSSALWASGFESRGGHGPLAELADAEDLKSSDGNIVPVRIREGLRMSNSSTTLLCNFLLIFEPVAPALGEKKDGKSQAKAS